MQKATAPGCGSGAWSVITVNSATFAIIPAGPRPTRSPKTSRRLAPLSRRGNASGGTMRHASVASGIAVLSTLLGPADAAPVASARDFVSRASVMEWIDNYRNMPEPSRVPEAVRALSEFGALREPETAGFYVGFVAGVLGANPKEAERLVGKMLPLPPADQWLVVRAIAYSGLPAWKSLLARTAAKVPARRGMVDAYLTGALPTLDAIELDKSPTFLEKMGEHLGVKHKAT